MIYFWLLIALGVTIIGALLILLLEADRESFEEEVDFEERILQQRASITVADCAADDACRAAHETSLKRLAKYLTQKMR